MHRFCAHALFLFFAALLAQAAPRSTAAELKVQVFDSSTGQPIENAEVFYIIDSPNRSYHDLVTFQKWTHCVRTPKNGEVTLKEEAGAPLMLCVTAKGRDIHVIQPHKRSSYLVGEALKVPLSPGGSISGVVYRKGKPAPGMLVSLESGSPSIEWNGIGESDVRADALGRYQFTNLKPNTYLIIADNTYINTDPSMTFRRWVELHPGENLTVNCGEEPGGKPTAPAPAASGPLTPIAAPGSAPVAAPSPSIALPAAPQPRSEPQPEPGVTATLATEPAVEDQDHLPLGEPYLRRYENGKRQVGMGTVFLGRKQQGRWVFLDVDSPGEYRLERNVTLGQCATLWITDPKPFRIENSQSRPDLGEIRITLEHCLNLNGTVVDAQGAPLARARVSLFPEWDWSSHVPFAETDASGHFAIPRLLPGFYEAVVSQRETRLNYHTLLELKDNQPVTVHPAPLPTATIPFSLPSGVAATRRAKFSAAHLYKTDASGVMPRRDSDVLDDLKVVSFQQDALIVSGRYQGRFKLHLEYEAAPNVRYSAEVPLPFALDTTRGDQKTAKISLPAPGTCTLRGTLQDRAGQPVRLGRICLTPSFKTPWQPFYARTDEQGRFVLSDLPGGKYELGWCALSAADRDIPRPDSMFSYLPVGGTLTLSGDLSRDFVVDASLSN